MPAGLHRGPLNGPREVSSFTDFSPISRHVEAVFSRFGGISRAWEDDLLLGLAPDDEEEEDKLEDLDEPENKEEEVEEDEDEDDEKEEERRTMWHRLTYASNITFDIHHKIKYR